MRDSFDNVLLFKGYWEDELKLKPLNQNIDSDNCMVFFFVAKIHFRNDK